MQALNNFIIIQRWLDLLLIEYFGRETGLVSESKLPYKFIREKQWKSLGVLVTF